MVPTCAKRSARRSRRGEFRGKIRFMRAGGSFFPLPRLRGSEGAKSPVLTRCKRPLPSPPPQAEGGERMARLVIVGLLSSTREDIMRRFLSHGIAVASAALLAAEFQAAPANAH